jgi:hypothetical protein
MGNQRTGAAKFTFIGSTSNRRDRGNSFLSPAADGRKQNKSFGMTHFI